MIHIMEDRIPVTVDNSSDLVEDMLQDLAIVRCRPSQSLSCQQWHPGQPIGEGLFGRLLQPFRELGLA